MSHLVRISFLCVAFSYHVSEGTLHIKEAFLLCAMCLGMRAGLVVECWTPEREVGDSILTQVAVIMSLAHDTFTSEKYWQYQGSDASVPA